MTKSASPKYGKAPKPSYNKPAQPTKPSINKVTKITKAEN